MFTELFYRDKGLFLQSLHPATVLVYLTVLLILALVFANPLYLLALFLLLALLIREADGVRAWEGFLRAGVFLMLVIMTVNPLVIRAGKTIIWHGPQVPYWGRLDVSLEALYFGAVAGLRLLVMLSIFCLYNLVLNPDRLLNLFSGIAGRSVLLITLATRLLPAMAQNLQRTAAVLRLRGVDIEAGGLRQKVKGYACLYNILLLSSLEDALAVAESMQARAFGSGRRSVYRRNTFRPRDTLCTGGSLLALLAACWGWRSGYGRFTFYPEADYLIKDGATLGVLGVVLLYLSVPLILSAGWKRCRFLRSKI
ncbi:energy-coupling factor transport system permease protein [Thermodesulfitimonas autotrophica]|uniref:Energy-coupling factor transport system permease protein n=1 Tax=Thermodesulfitimonas autotrophica TaxID=1894989 RepID=A0A3N5BTY4_9THEO|nr:energy-coupling factor transporter transmembrane component T [Thermodesulfitimonas autotrophica]RPF49335.1 energy-coupling factor transport system permease protein [Thermodesulfitimonas autotrophica]